MKMNDFGSDVKH